MDMVSRYGLMDLSTKENGKTTRQMGMANLYMQTETFMRVNGRMIRHMEWATTSMRMELPIMESGKMTNSMGRELKHGLIVQNMKASIMKVKNTERELCSLLMVVSTQGTSSLMKYQAKENMFGQMENLTKDNGRKIKCMDMVCSLGKMEKDMKVSLSMIKEKDKASSFGKMAEYMMECGKMENNMEKVHSLQKMVFKGRESGRKAEKQNGYLEDK
jgi:hypothetical protein